MGDVPSVAFMEKPTPKDIINSPTHKNTQRFMYSITSARVGLRNLKCFFVPSAVAVSGVSAVFTAVHSSVWTLTAALSSVAAISAALHCELFPHSRFPCYGVAAEQSVLPSCDCSSSEISCIKSTPPNCKCFYKSPQALRAAFGPQLR